MFNPPGSVGFSPHQDDFYTRTDRPDDVITVWSAADRVDVENGALDGFPGSHMQGMVPLKKDYKYLLPKAPEMAKNGTRMLAPRNALSIPRYLPQSRKSRWKYRRDPSVLSTDIWCTALFQMCPANEPDVR
jgi:hypothetical protein